MKLIPIFVHHKISRWKKILSLAFFMTTHFICSGQTCSPDALLIRGITASETDVNINPEEQQHQIYFNPSCEQNNQLLLHLVGTFDNPANTTFFPSMAANNGFKVISLKYINSTPAFTTCSNSTDVNCFEKYRQEIIFGTDSSNAVDVDSSNAIINRFEKFLIYLDDLYPSENWNQFLNGSDINWSNIILSGHSQGGGHAAFIAKQFAVKRAISFAAPNDFSQLFSAPAPWLSSNSATPDLAYFAFGNVFDEIVDFDLQFQNWQAMNLLTQTDSSNVDHSMCDYNQANVLYTAIDLSPGLAVNHSSVIIDNATPLSSGIPLFTPVWKYLLGICESTTSLAYPDQVDLEVKLFPNPTTAHLMVKSSQVISKAELYNSLGKQLVTIRPNANNFQLDLSPYRGLLILQLSAKDFKVLSKIVSVQ